MRHLRSLFTVFSTVTALVALTVASSTAQQTGTVRGTVRAADGAALGGATVTVQGTDLGTLVTPEGTYVIEQVPAGSQTIRVQSLGYRTTSQTVQVQAGSEVTANFTLQLDPLSMEELVVTGTATEVQKLEASYALTTLNDEEINEQAASSTAELLEVVPGFYVEASGGQSGNNVWARGIPQDGSFRYVAMYENGLPVYESPELAFTNIDALHRTDLTVRTMEAVRGGSAGIFASNAPGGLINFVDKTGGEELSGTIKLTAGDYNHFRAAFNVGGPLAGDDDWRFNVGGFYRYDTGVRDPGFPANRGGQLKANVTRHFDDGYIRIYGKLLKDRNIFYLPVPLQNPDDPEGIEGFDPNFGTLTSLDAGRVQILNPEGAPLERDLTDGVEVDYRSVTAEASFDLGEGWSIRNRARAMAADVQFNAIFSVNNPLTAEAYAEQQVDELGGTGYQYSFANSQQAISSPANLNGNGLVVESGWWGVTKPLDNFVNDLRFTKAWDTNSLTFGFYFSEYGAEDFWNFNNVLMEVRDQPRLLDLEVTGTDDGAVSVTDNGFTEYGNFYRNANNQARVFAGYVQDEWQATEELRIDAGVRFESGTYTGNVEVLEDFDLGDPTTTADDAVTWGSGRFRPYDHSFEDVAVSVAANYSLSDQLSVFGRGTNSFRQPDFEQWADGSVDTKGESEEIWQWEGGVKYGSPTLGIFTTAFYSTLTDIPFVDEVVQDGDLITLRRFADSETFGVESEIIWRPTDPFELNIRGTAQRPEYTDLRFEIEDPSEFEEFDFSGNQIRRVPQFILSARPKLTVPEDARAFGGTSFNVNWQYISKRYVDDANNVTLPGYHKVSAGFSFPATDRFTVEGRVHNMFNAIGLTEGNPRVGQVVGTEQDIYMARPILGRSATVSVAYEF